VTHGPSLAGLFLSVEGSYSHIPPLRGITHILLYISLTLTLTLTLIGGISRFLLYGFLLNHADMSGGIYREAPLYMYPEYPEYLLEYPEYPESHGAPLTLTLMWRLEIHGVYRSS